MANNVQVDAMGDACPIPVVKTLKALRELVGAGTIVTLVDNEVAVKMAGEQNLTVLDEAMTSEPYALAFAKGSDLVDQVNQALSQLLQDGTVEQIAATYGLQDAVILE